MKARKGCWTCTARRIQCDGGLPTCQKCARASRLCQGYERRLSWPKNNDKKRTIIGDSPQGFMYPSQKANFFINTTWRDMKLYQNMYLKMQSLHLSQPPLGPWKQSQSAASHPELIQYFHSAAYLSLVTFTTTTSQIRDVLLRMALADNTGPGLALFYALLAFSTLHRSGLHQQAVQLKILSLQSLSASTTRGPLSPAEAAQHVAASMLLSAFETLQSESSGEWLWYIWGAMDIAQATSLQDQSHVGDIGYLLDWVYYHDALSRFPIYHWRHKSLSLNATDANPRGLRNPSLATHRLAPPPLKPAHALLNLLSEACGTLLNPWDPRCRNKEYHNSLKKLEGRVGSLPTMPISVDSGADTTLAVELHQIAIRIYLARGSQSLWEPPTNLDSLIEEAFAGQIMTCLCVHFFPLFILACEARTDERRTAILNLIDRTEKSDRARSMKGLKVAIQSVWVQQDLHTDSELLVDYLGIMSVVISSSNALPYLV